MSYLSKIWENISAIGVDNNMDNELRRNIVLMNRLCVTWIPVIIPYSLLFLYFDLPAPALTVFSLAISHLIAIGFNYLRRYTISRLIESTSSSIIIMLAACMAYDGIGPAWKPSLFVLLLAFLAFPFLFFRMKELPLIIFSVAINIGCLFLFKVLNSSLYIGYNNEIFRSEWYDIFNFFIAAFILVVTLVYMLSINTKHTKTIEKLLNETQEQNEEILLQKEEIEAQRDVLNRQKLVLEKQNQEITDSIQYAENIQYAVLPDPKQMKSVLQEYFIIYKPKDIVGGDFYFVSQIDEWKIIVVADCTGHGVPGGFMSMMGIAFLKEIINRKEITKASQIIESLRNEIVCSLEQRESEREYEIKDGMDISVVILNTVSKELQYAGAFNPAYLLTSGQLPEFFNDLIIRESGELKLLKFKPDKMPVGTFHKTLDPFTNLKMPYKDGDMVYMMTDGYIDQFGGDHGKKFMSKKLEECFMDMGYTPVKDQKEYFINKLDSWRNAGTEKEYEQVDDIVLLGFKILT